MDMKKTATHAGALALVLALAGPAAAQSQYLCRTNPEQTAAFQTAQCREQDGQKALSCRFEKGAAWLLSPEKADAAGWVQAKVGEEVLSCRRQDQPLPAPVQAVPPQMRAAALAALSDEGLKDALNGMALAMAAPAAFFDGGVSRAGAPAVLPQTGALTLAAKCTPGVDCPEEKPQPRPQTKPQAKPKCTPGVDCPDDTRPSKPRCTPGVDCPEDRNGGGKEPGNGGRTPLPPNYRPRPSNPPSYFPPYERAPYDDDRVDVAGYWHMYRTFLGSPVRSGGSWSQTTGSAALRRGGKETDLKQGASYTARLQSQSQRSVYALYWRYVGRDCHPDYRDQCQSWEIQYRWFYDGVETGSSSFMEVDVEFQDEAELLPWEKESFELLYDGLRVSLRQSDPAFRYQVRGPMVDQQNGRAAFVLTQGQRLLRSPEAGKVGLTLVNSGGLKLVVDDSRTEFYDGETLEVEAVVKYKKKWYQADVVVSRGVMPILVRSGSRRSTFNVGASQGSGTYYIDSWRFRRAGSKISSPNWIQKGEGNSATY
jgi:hypothetical protein